MGATSLRRLSASAGASLGVFILLTLSATVKAQSGSLQVFISPPGVVSDGAQWQVDGGEWHINLATVSGLAAGSHTVAFKPVTGWTSPTNQTVKVGPDGVVAISGTYKIQYLYRTNTGSASIYFYGGPSGVINIPKTLDGLPVTAIASGCFYGYCRDAFSAIIPDSIQAIGDQAFAYAPITNVIIGAGVTNIGRGAFASCGSLPAFTVSELNPSFCTLDGVLFTKDRTTLVQYPNGKAANSYTIPDTVTNIQSSAFQQCPVPKITINPGVISIGEGAFGSASLTDVAIPDSVLSIGRMAFLSSALTNATIGNGVTTIGHEAFERCGGLVTISIGDSVTAIGSNAFAYCPKLTRATIPNSVTNLGIWAFYQCSAMTNLTIGGNVPSIGRCAFSSCSSLISVAIPNSVTNIDDVAFSGCTSMTDLTLGDHVTALGYVTFSGCTSLRRVTIPDSLTNIGFNTFQDCTSLTNVILGNNISSISYEVFAGCTSLTDITFPDSVTEIVGAAFAGCSSLTRVGIGKNILSIGQGAFSGCVRLGSINVDPLNPVYCSIDGVLFDKNGTTLIQYPQGRIGSYAMPASVMNIQDYAFQSSGGLTSVTIPNSVTNIGHHAFASCSKLSVVKFGDNVSRIGDYAFDSCALTNITIPSCVTSLGGEAFCACTNLTGVYFRGNAPDMGWAVTGGNLNAKLYWMPGTTGWEQWSSWPFVAVAQWNPQVQMKDGHFGVGTRGFGFNITGANKMMVVVEACSDLTAPAWVEVGTNTLSDGSSYFSESQTNASRFYRLRMP